MNEPHDTETVTMPTTCRICRLFDWKVLVVVHTTTIHMCQRCAERVAIW